MFTITQKAQEHVSLKMVVPPSQKMGRRPKQAFLPRRHTNGQQAHEKMLNITNYQRNANQDYNEAWKQPKCPSTDKWIKKMWYIYTMEYYSAIKRNKTGSFVELYMDLDTVIQSEISQKEENKYRVLMHTCGIQKSGTDERVCKAEIETQMQRTNVWTLRGERRGWDELGDWD